jgi:membrane-associated phospholipid phosphatase
MSANVFRDIDDHGLFAINWLARQTSPAHTLVLDYAKYGIAAFAVLLLVGLFLARRTDSARLAAAGWTPIAMLIALGLNQPLGRLVGEARPYVTHPHILRLADVTSDFSFPSDHSVMAGAVATGLLLVHRRLGLIAVGLALLLAFARVYIAAHYPWDVLCGLAFGAAITGLGWLALRRPLTAFTSWIRRQAAVRALFGPQDSAPA